MDFAGLKEAAAREIALAFGVPPMLLALPAVTTADAAAGTEMGWRGAMTYAQMDGMAQPLGWIGRGAVMGESATALPAHHGLLGSPDTVLEVEWLHGDMDLPPPMPPIRRCSGWRGRLSATPMPCRCPPPVGS